RLAARRALAGWRAPPTTPSSARAGANRLWAQFMGRGLVDPVDNFSPSVKPSHPELLRALTDRLVADKFDLKPVIRELVNSETYQLSGKGNSTAALPPWFERADVRPLSAEELMTSIRVATGFPQGEKLPGDFQNYFVRYFGEPTNGRGDFQGSLTEHLFLNNSGGLRQMIQPRKGNLADSILSSKAPWEERVER